MDKFSLKQFKVFCFQNKTEKYCKGSTQKPLPLLPAPPPPPQEEFQREIFDGQLFLHVHGLLFCFVFLSVSSLVLGFHVFEPFSVRATVPQAVFEPGTYLPHCV